MWDLDGRDKSKPLSEMIDMQAYQQRKNRRQRQAQHQRDRSESRSAILCGLGAAASLSYLTYVVVPAGFWKDLASFLASQ